MKQKVVSLLIVWALMAAAFTADVTGQSRGTTEEVKIRAAEYQSKGKEVVVRVRAGAKILVGKKEFPFAFSENANLSGRVKELRDKDFVLAEKGGHTEITAVISYDDVLNIKHLSGFEKTFKGVGRISLGLIAIPVVLPLYGIMAMLGRLPEC